MELVRALIGPDDGSASIAQLCARAVIIFVFGVVCIRIAGRRTFSQATPLDIIVALIIGSNLARCMTGKAPFFGGLAASLVLVLLHRIVAMATLRWGWLAKLMKAKPTVLIRDGLVDDKALARHGMTRGDLEAGLRMEQTRGPEEVGLAMLEDSGQISVVPRSKAG